ncbi:MAG TPA: hypothetical protein VKQ27_20085 [Acetobacteraceae bacterium]|nr:hypothetical protein [Acetobacteraceae bacterium]
METDAGRGGDVAHQYTRLEERILARDQVGAGEAFYDLVRAARPLNEIVAECVRIHAPFTHVPYHERIDDGYPNFVNNDHCLLSARATLHLARLMPDGLAMLPMAQTIWYIPTGLDIWNQKINKATGHYTRGFDGKIENPPAPVVYWPDQQPLRSREPLKERLGEWLTLVQRGEVLPAYRTFLGLMEEVADRKEVLAELVFAGMIDVQDRMYRNRSYTTGHKAYRARSTVELGNALGWDNAHNVIYAGALDMAVGPRWHSLYEMACNTIKEEIEGVVLHAVPYGGVSDAELAMLRNTGALQAEEEFEVMRGLLHEHSPASLDGVTRMLRAGKDPRRIVDVIQIAAAEIVLATHGVNNFSMPMHCYEYTNALGWFYDTFEHPRRLRLLYVAAEFVNMTAWHQKLSNACASSTIHAPASAQGLDRDEMLRRIDEAICSFDGPASLSWVQAYCSSVPERVPLVRTLALAACKLGNDPHNQEIPQNMLEDFGKNQSARRDRLLLACAQHCASHRKYGDPFEAAQRFARTMGVALG